MLIASCEQMREIDKRAIESGIPGIVLMENAAMAVVKHLPRCARPAIFCGRGNNGGDGFAIARHLRIGGVRPVLVLPEGAEGLKGDALINYNIARKMGICIADAPDASCDLVVDALLGTGIRGPVSNAMSRAIDAINSMAVPIIAADIPSGIHGDSGRVMGNAVRAHKTITFGLLKPGLVTHPGAEYAGEVIADRISIPDYVIDGFNFKWETVDGEAVRHMLPARPRASHKGDFGRVAIIGGSRGMSGAACLAAEGALRAGGGLVTVLTPEDIEPIVAASVREAMTVALPPHDLESAAHFPATAVAVGPGLGQSASAVRLLSRIVRMELDTPLVVDADGINILAENIDLLGGHTRPIILTPHPGEMARLTGTSIKEIQEGRLAHALEFAQRYNVTLVLKGAGTVTAAPDGAAFINITGNPGMAIGGSGDVLAGIIAALAAQGMDVTAAAACGVYLHGSAGDAAARALSEQAMKAGDILDFLPEAIINAKERMYHE